MFAYSMRADIRRQVIALLELSWKSACHVTHPLYTYPTKMKKELHVLIWGLQIHFNEEAHSQMENNEDRLYLRASQRSCYNHIYPLTYKNSGVETGYLISQVYPTSQDQPQNNFFTFNTVWFHIFYPDL